MFRGLEIGAIFLAASVPATVAVRVSEPVPAAVMAARAVAEPVELATVEPLAGEATIIPRAADGMFYLRARVNGVAVRFLVDTGANVIVLTRADAAAVGASGEAAMVGDSLKTVSGTVETRWTKLDLDVKGRKLASLDAALIDRGVGVSLLGQNALAAFHSITIERDRMILR
jgi:aspartyl protease family protein